MRRTFAHPFSAFAEDWVEFTLAWRIFVVVLMTVAGLIGFVSGIAGAVLALTVWP